MSKQQQGKGAPGKARFIEPPNVLRQKCGYGGLDPTRLQRAENFIDENQLDFGPYALKLMAQLDEIIKDCKSGKRTGAKARDDLTKPIMELKANGGMFKYMLMSEIADIALNFLENIPELDDDVFEIIHAHQNTLNVIIASGLKGTGGKEGRILAEELFSACKRYYKKHNIKPRG